MMARMELIQCVEDHGFEKFKFYRCAMFWSNALVLENPVKQCWQVSMNHGFGVVGEFVFVFCAGKQLLLSAHLSHRNSVCHTGGSVKSGAS